MDKKSLSRAYRIREVVAKVGTDVGQTRQTLTRITRETDPRCSGDLEKELVVPDGRNYKTQFLIRDSLLGTQ